MSERSRPRLFRFGLRALLGTMTILALVFVVFGYKINQARRQEAAVGMLVAAGGQFTYHHQVTSRSSRFGTAMYVDLDATPPVSSRLSQHWGIKPVSLILATNSHPEREDFEALGDLSYLEELTLNQGYLSDTLMAGLPAMTRLRSLQIEASIHTSDNDNIKDFSFLQRLPRLQVYSHPFSEFSDSDVKHLIHSSNLLKLDLSYTKLADGLQTATFHNLVWLNLAGTRITDGGLRGLGALPQLNHLNLNSTLVTDDGIAYLSSLPRLQTLSLTRTQITDAAAMHFTKMPRLTKLRIISTQMSDTAAQRLQEALPNCSIWFDGKKPIAP